MSTPAYAPTNVEIGALIGMGHSGVSRIRNGDRLPSLDAMRRIERATGWTIGSQVHHREQGTYVREFEHQIAEALARLRKND